MTARAIVMWPESWLNKKSEPVAPEEFNSDQLKELAKDMLDTMEAAGGLGISAVQIGVHKRVMVVPLRGIDGKFKPVVLCNPELSEFSKETQAGQEGCLSLPTVLVQKERCQKVKVTGKLIDGTNYEDITENMQAIAVQHEYDHLEGKTIADGVGPVKRQLIQKKLLNFEKERAREQEKTNELLEQSRKAKAGQTASEDYTIPSRLTPKP